MEGLGQLLFGMILALFAGAAVSAAVFRVRHWHDWPHRWQTAHPAITLFLGFDLFHRWLTQERELPRSRAQAILWEAPTLLIGSGVMIGGTIAATAMAS